MGNRRTLTALVTMRGDAFIAAGLLLACAVMWFWLIPNYVIGTGGDRHFIRGLTLAVAAMSVVMLAVSISRATDGADPDDEGLLLERDDKGEPAGFMLLAVIWGIDAFLIPYLGFYPLAVVSIATTMVVLGERRPASVLLWTAIPLAAVFVIFEYGFELTMPRGSVWIALLR